MDNDLVIRIKASNICMENTEKCLDRSVEIA